MSERLNLISQLFNKRQCKAIQDLYVKDPSSHKAIYQSISVKLFDNEKIILAKGLDMLSLILKQNSFGATDEEIMMVAVFIYKSFFYDSILPYLSEGNSLDFSIKTLVSLSFFRKTMEKRTERFGAPSPNYYRETSKLVFKYHGYDGIAKSHQNWESFLVEALIV